MVSRKTARKRLVKKAADKKGPLNKKIRTPGESKKFKAYVKDPKTGNVKTEHEH